MTTDLPTLVVGEARAVPLEEGGRVVLVAPVGQEGDPLVQDPRHKVAYSCNPYG